MAYKLKIENTADWVNTLSLFIHFLQSTDMILKNESSSPRACLPTLNLVASPFLRT